MLIELLLGVYQNWPFMHLIYVLLPVYLTSLIGRLIGLTPALFINSVLNLHSQLKLYLLGYFVGFGEFKIQVIEISVCLGILMVAFISSFFNRSVVSLLLIFIAPMPYLTANYTKWYRFSKFELSYFL